MKDTRQNDELNFPVCIGNYGKHDDCEYCEYYKECIYVTEGSES